MCDAVAAGWEEGAGLGAREQGIQEPIKGGEVRDKNDKYKVRLETRLPSVADRNIRLFSLFLGGWYGHAGSV